MEIAAHYVICKICGERFDRDKEEFVKVNGNRYAHKKCFEQKDEIQNQMDKDKESFEDYVKGLYGIDYLLPLMQKQIKSYVENYNYSYSGMQKTLYYFYEVKRNRLDINKPTLGIIPYVYAEAHNYFYSLWLTKQKNESKVISDYIPQERVVKIPVPQRKIRKRKVFSFLDDEV